MVQHGDFSKLLMAIQPRGVLHSSYRYFSTALMQVSVREDERENLTSDAHKKYKVLLLFNSNIAVDYR